MHEFTKQPRAATIVMSAAASRRCQGKVAVCRAALWHAHCRRILLIAEGSASRLHPDRTLESFWLSPQVLSGANLSSAAQAMEGVCAAVCAAFSVAYSGYFFTHLARK